MKAKTIFYALKFSDRAFFVIFLIVFITQIVDAIIGTLADILWEFTFSLWGVALFFSIPAIYGFGQYFILEMVKSKNKEKEMAGIRKVLNEAAEFIGHKIKENTELAEHETGYK